MKSEPRKSKRVHVNTGIVKTPAGFCQIVNLNPDGLSFRCLKRCLFSQEWSLDIYDTSGLNLEHLQVKKIYEKQLSNLETPVQFTMLVGVAFQNLTPSQKKQLILYLRQVEGSLK
ncbi:hypothetical protein FCL47_01765 [Desulfopila sp. IMCC35006]|uniref:hypothetical protein n=1 Tax=Desulfopila sp. IMCC35006 TaxID=2569542 RepID=UPI0010AD3F8A|nr:hypothetical protein [Desulfopila sp. IMCC35006]TKB28247.1 hypothetical protein FCL47_01765 [Desulfopila sp. IMCC35006]